MTSKMSTTAIAAVTTTERGSFSAATSRIEVFFKNKQQLRERIDFLSNGGSTISSGFSKYNIVNKHSSDTLLEWMDTIRNQHKKNGGKVADICVHYSLKYQKASGGRSATVQDHLDRLVQFMSNVPRSNDSTTTEILLVSGSVSTKTWNTVVALQELAKLKKTSINETIGDVKFAVAFNPFFPNENERQQEYERLKQKIDTGLVSKVYLQFGTDLEVLEYALDFLQINFPTTAVGASLFLPTPTLIAQQKFRPWKGVYLSAEFLSGSDAATGIVVHMMSLFAERNVEILWEAPGVRTQNDLDLIQDLYKEATRLIKIRKALAPTPPSNNLHSSTASIASESTETSASTSNSHINSKSSFAGYSMTTPESDDQSIETNEQPVTKPVTRSATKASTETSMKKMQINGVRFSPIPKPTKGVDYKKPSIVLFGSHDMRLFDNEALVLALHHKQILPIFFWDTEQPKFGVTGCAQVLVKDALKKLERSLTSFNLHLLCINTNDQLEHELLCKIVQETGASAVYYNREFTTDGRECERQRHDALNKTHKHVKVVPCVSSLLYDVELLDLPGGFAAGHWGTLMHFYRGCKKQLPEPRKPYSWDETCLMLQRARVPPQTTTTAILECDVDDLENIAVMPPKTKWDVPILERFDMSEQAARGRLDLFMEKGLKRYETAQRSRADKDLATSQLSVHLRFGVLSPNEMYWRTADSDLSYDDKKTFARRLIWRDLAYFQLYCFPKMPSVSIRKHYENTDWMVGKEEKRRLDAWKKGKTGYPIVDAGMRELYATGWMTQSVRMVVASFLVEYLRVNWTRGAEWFHYTLADADVAINSMMWQNAGRSGVDQWNFVVSPMTGSQDPTGSYTRKWVPELAKLPKTSLHRPWETFEGDLRVAGVELGKTYPHRIVEDLNAERAISVENVLKMRRNAQEYNDDRGYDIIEIPNNKKRGGKIGTEKTIVFTTREYRINRSGSVMKKNESATPPTSKFKRRRSPESKRRRTSPPHGSNTVKKEWSPWRTSIM